MKTIEHWVLRVADSDLTWLGLNWLRPAKHQHLGPGYILLSSFLLGLPGIVVGVGMIYWALGHVGAGVWLSLFALVMLVEVLLHVQLAYFWNRRAAGLVGTDGRVGPPAAL